MVSWKKTRIGEFMFERKGKYRPNDKVIAGLRRINKIDFSGNFHISKKLSKTNMILVCPEDFVISGINISKGAMGIYYGDEDVTATIHYSSYRFDTVKINVEYFKIFLKSTEFIKLLQEQVKGGIKTEIKAKHILPLEIDLPDIKAQKIIASYFKNIETEDVELKQELTHQRTLLKKLRQQILQEAIEGKLTVNWRTANPVIEPASELLKRIQIEKEQLINDKTIKKQKWLPPVGEEEKVFELPDGWEWCRLGDIAIINPRNTVFDDIEAGFTPMPLVSGILFQQPKYELRKWGNIKKGFTHFADNDVVVAKITPCFENSKSGVIQGFPNGIGAGTTELHVVRRLTNDIEAYYVYCFIKTSRFLEDGKRLMKGAVGQKRVPKEYMENTLLPLPPLQEQKVIVAKVAKLLRLCDQLETKITDNQDYAEKLLQSVLKEAFSQSRAE